MTYYALNKPQKLILGWEAHFLGVFADGKEALVSGSNPWRFALIDRITGFPRQLKTIFSCEDRSRNPSGFEFKEFRAISGCSGYLIGSEMNRTCRRTNAHCHDAMLIWADIDVDLRTINLRELVDVAEMENLNQFFILNKPDGKGCLLSCSTVWSVHGTGGYMSSEVIGFMDETANLEEANEMEGAQEAEGADNVEQDENGDPEEHGEQVEQAEGDERVERRWRRFEPTVLQNGDQAFLAVMGADEDKLEPDVLQVLVVRKDGTKTPGVIDVPAELRGMYTTTVDGVHNNHVFVCVEKFTSSHAAMETYAIDLRTLTWKLAVPEFDSASTPLLQCGELHFAVGLSEIWSYKLDGSPQALRQVAASACNVGTWSAWEHRIFQKRGALVKAEFAFKVQKRKELVSRQRALHNSLWYPKDVKKYIRDHKASLEAYNSMMNEYLNPPALQFTKTKKAPEEKTE